MKTWQSILYGTFLGLLAAAVILLITRRPHGKAIELEPVPTLGPVIVDISGAVNKPGVYSLPNGSRNSDLIVLAGGLSANADPAQVNLAARLRDEQKIIIPAIDEIFPTLLPTVGEKPSKTTTISPDLPVNINEATLDQLQLIPGVGPTKAKDILTYREQNGKFTKIEDLLNVHGIGPGTLENIKPYITLDAP